MPNACFQITFHWNEHNQIHISFSKKISLNLLILHSNVDRQIRKDNYNWIVTYWLINIRTYFHFFFLMKKSLSR
jgi:hypothetical protein